MALDVGTPKAASELATDLRASDAKNLPGLDSLLATVVPAIENGRHQPIPKNTEIFFDTAAVLIKCAMSKLAMDPNAGRETYEAAMPSLLQTIVEVLNDYNADKQVHQSGEQMGCLFKAVQVRPLKGHCFSSLLAKANLYLLISSDAHRARWRGLY